MFGSKIVYFLFFFSGATGLIYEIVWSRLFVLIFGSTTGSIVAVISAFLGGLALGGLIFGRLADTTNPKKLIRLYAFLELAVGCSAVATLLLIPLIRVVYSNFSNGVDVGPGLLLTKFFLSILILIVPATFMGGTLPVLSRFLKSTQGNLDQKVSLLYGFNTIGAVVGVLLCAFVLIEVLGLSGTLISAALLNFLIAIVALQFKPDLKKTKIGVLSASRPLKISRRMIGINGAFFLSGLVAIAYEIIWTRILTPTVGTFIYAFAIVLAIYLFGIGLGSLFYKYYSKAIRSRMLAFSLTQLAIGFFALGSVLLTSNLVVVNKYLMVILVLLPATVFMGLTFPVIISLFRQDNNAGETVGISYFFNTVGCIVGGFLASFYFIPKFGSSQAIVFLTLINFVLAVAFLLYAKKIAFRKTLIVFCIGVIVFTSWVFLFRRHSLFENTTQWRINWAKQTGLNYMFAEDETASVFGYQNPKNNDQNLFIDGVPTTGRVIETKLMAHIPLLLHDNPKDMLIIAFGMGSTFRSSLVHGVNTDVVELVPSVPKMFELFHADAKAVLANKKGRIIINDGRNYIFLTNKKYDVVTIDPPPPFNAAGTTVLYSKNFYKDIAKKLNEGGIVNQWMWFGSREDDIKMAIKSFVEVYPYVVAFKPLQGSGGIFLEGSFSPINVDPVKFSGQKASFVAGDLAELNSEFSLSDVPSLLIADRAILERLTSDVSPITDQRPNTEYFILRHYFYKSPDLTKVGGLFIKSLEDSFKRASR